MSYIPKRGPWHGWKDKEGTYHGITFRSYYDYRQFDRNPSRHRYWDRFPQLKRWALQYERLHDVPPEESMQKGSEFRHRLDRMLENTR